jgi:hypothetical protein
LSDQRRCIRGSAFQGDFGEASEALKCEADFGVGANRRCWIDRNDRDHLARVLGIEAEGGNLTNFDAIECDSRARLKSRY